jgi:RNA polymerase sigma-70 factor (ECF subfamily)
VGIRDLERGSALCAKVGDDFDRVLASARSGEGRAFAQLYESMNRRVLAFVTYRGAADPEGMVNEVFFKAFTRLDSFDGNEIQFTAWIFKIARNTLIDESRSRSRRVDETSLSEFSESHLAGGDVEVEAGDRMSSDEVLRHLDVLTPEQRDIIVMRVVSDLTIEAIAEILDKRAGAVKAMQRRALRTLARHFDTGAVPR